MPIIGFLGLSLPIKTPFNVCKRDKNTTHGEQILNKFTATVVSVLPKYPNKNLIIVGANKAHTTAQGKDRITVNNTAFNAFLFLSSNFAEDSTGITTAEIP